MLKALKLFSIGTGYTASALAAPFLGLSIIKKDFESGIVFLCVCIGAFVLAEDIRKSMFSENDAS